MGKFDLIALSKKKAYKITLGVVLGLGILLLAVGLLLSNSVTKTVTANRLNVEFSGQGGTYPNYKATITADLQLIINTGTSNRALAEPIVLTLDEDAQSFLFLPEDKFYRDGKPVDLQVMQDPENNGKKGYLYITCGSYRVNILFTYAYDANVPQ